MASGRSGRIIETAMASEKLNLDNSFDKTNSVRTQLLAVEYALSQVSHDKHELERQANVQRGEIEHLKSRLIQLHELIVQKDKLLSSRVIRTYLKMRSLVVVIYEVAKQTIWWFLPHRDPG